MVQEKTKKKNASDFLDNSPHNENKSEKMQEGRLCETFKLETLIPIQTWKQRDGCSIGPFLDSDQRANFMLLSSALIGHVRDFNSWVWSWWSHWQGTQAAFQWSGLCDCHPATLTSHSNNCNWEENCRKCDLTKMR